MFCSNCGTENNDDAKFCLSCGNPNSAEATQGTVASKSVPAIWNPNAAANWSVLLTPAFGSFVQAKNWKTLEQPKKATASMVWFFLGLVVLVTTLFIPDQQAMGVAFWYLIIWYLIAGRSQAKYVKKEFGDNFEKKPWGKPILIAIGGIIVYLILAAMVVV